MGRQEPCIIILHIPSLASLFGHGIHMLAYTVVVAHTYTAAIGGGLLAEGTTAYGELCAENQHGPGGWL